MICKKCKEEIKISEYDTARSYCVMYYCNCPGGL